ncbi:Strictosidine synthase, conserved region, partial [Dillenia turbinata]
MSGDLYIADAYLGLHMVGPEGGQASKLVTRAHGIPFKFINGLDKPKQWRLTAALISTGVSGDRSGRLLKYNQKGKRVTVLVENLRYPNGVALSKDSNHILIAETPTCRILKFWLKTSRAGSLEDIPIYQTQFKRRVLGRNLFEETENCKMDNFKSFLLKLPVDPMRLQSMLTKWGGGGLAIKMNEEGKKWRSIGEVEGTLWIGSVTEPYAGMCNTSL